MRWICRWMVGPWQSATEVRGTAFDFDFNEDHGASGASRKMCGLGVTRASDLKAGDSR
jgi:hypothetical protein